MNYIFLGVEVSKDTLHLCDGRKTFTFPNERGLEDLKHFLKERY